jgi:transcriptional regulator with XRE-family HTH domain
MSAERQASTGDRDLVDRATDVDQYLATLRQAVHDAGWTIEALAAHLDIDKSYLSRMLSGEKEWRTEHHVALPDEIDALFLKRQAAERGWIVVEPVLCREQAFESALKLFVGLFAPSSPLPQRADRMAHAELRTASQPSVKVG